MAVNYSMQAEEMILEEVTNFIELLDVKLDGWYEIKTDKVYVSNSSGPRVGPGTAWVYKGNTTLFGACENLPDE